MAQKTNLNVSPYYDDYSAAKNFYKVLYKPGFPVQARELTTSQSILQEQLGSFANSIFDDGSQVIGGEIGFDNQFHAVKLNTINLGVDISVYIKEFIGTKITGQTSGLSATVKYVALPSTDNIDDITIYVTYISSDNDFKINTFTDGESLICSTDVIYGNTTISTGTPFASLISTNATAIGSSAKIKKGVFYIRGYFVDVEEQTLILDYYNNDPTYRVGLTINESIIRAKDDDSLYDNAKGFSNYASPGADRLKITLTLSKKLLTDKNDTDFVELLVADDGQIKVIENDPNWSRIRDYVADRTYDESGHYAVTPFIPSIHNSLNDNLGNNGLFFKNQKTEQNNDPSDDLMCVKISPGKAYVRGYDVEKPGTTILDIEKPRDVGISSDSAINVEVANILKVNNVQGVPKQGEIIELYDNLNNAGVNIGSARAYSFNLINSKYVDKNTTWDLRLFDIQTNTALTLNKAISSVDLPKGSYVKGLNSGASGYAIGAGNNSVYVNLNQTSGTFSKGETIEINGIPFSGTIGLTTVYNTQNIKSVKQVRPNTDYPDISGDGFKADTQLERFRVPNNITTVDISIASGSPAISTVTAANRSFSGLRVGSVVRYSNPLLDVDNNLETINKVTGISTDRKELELTAISNAGVFNGALPTAGVQVSLFAAAPLIKGTGSLYVPLSDSNISFVDLDKSNLKITKQLTGETTDGNGKLTSSMSDVKSLYPEIKSAIFDSFDEEKYSIHYSSGGIGTITSDTFVYTDSENISISDLEVSQTSNVVLNSTVIKQGIRSKIKDYNRSQVLNVSYSKYAQSGSVAVGNGAAAVADGLTYDKRYGLRVQDEIISLNYPDVVKFLAVYESFDSSAPTLDVLEFPATVNVSLNAVIGEKIIGSNNNVAVAQIVTKPSANKLGIVYLTGVKFTVNENVSFDESNINTSIESITLGNYKDITNNYRLNKGQKNEYYDYSSLVRNDNAIEPSNPLLIVFDYYSVPSSDNGDLFTVLSYGADRFSTDIPKIGSLGIRASDTFDFRPRVNVYDPSTDTDSPFNFDSRDFGTSLKQYATPNEICTFDYNYYLPRIDKLYLNTSEEFIYEKGVSSKNPKPPFRNDDLMDIATITLPPYLYNPQDAKFRLVDNRRYTMRDIGYIEDRVSNLEEVTSLSLLENSVQSLQIQDSEGRSRFKSGFFVDDFKNYSLMDKQKSNVEISGQEISALRSRNTLQMDVVENVQKIASKKDSGVNYTLLDENCQKTGNLITLAYDEIEWVEQEYATSDPEGVPDIENVNPYELPVYTGTLKLNPQGDVWTRTIQLQDKIKPVISGVDKNQSLTLDLEGSVHMDLGSVRQTRRGHNFKDKWDKKVRSSEETISDSISDSFSFTNIDTVSQNKLISSGSDDWMRSRNTEFKANGFSSYTQFYLFVDGQKVDFIPKLLEITPEPKGSASGSNGTFIIGEEVHALNDQNEVIMKFRVCQPNHKFGAYDNPDETYRSDPYSHGSEFISNNYNQSSRVLNVDTISLADEAQGLYYGYVEPNSRLLGQESSAEAYVKDLRLITDDYGDIIGSFFIRDPFSSPPPPVRINTGTKTVTLTTSEENKKVLPGGDADVIFANATYITNGTKSEWQNEVTTTETDWNFDVAASIEVQVSSEFTVHAEYTDPLAQTFVVGGSVNAPSAVNNANEDYSGAFLTAVDIFFATVDTESNKEVECQIRETTGDARPGRVVLGSVSLSPRMSDGDGNDVEVIKADPVSASVATKFTFPEPVYLAPGKSYAIVLLAPASVKFKVWTAVHGHNHVNTQTIPGNTGSSIQYTRQFGTGALFKSQNGALWTEDQRQDLTFRLYKANFTSTTGTVHLQNPDLNDSNGFITKLTNNPITTLPKTGKIGITTINSTQTGLLAALTPGRKICASRPTSTAVITGTGSSAISVDLTDGGSNYLVDSEVETFAITGGGEGLKLNILSVNSETGEIDGLSASPVTQGRGYKAGDVVGIKTSTVGTQGGQGRGARVTVGSIYDGPDTLYLTNIQGDNNSYTGNAGIAISYFDNSNVIVALANTTIIDNQFDSGINAGNYLKVDHFDHGMYSTNNKLFLTNIEPNVPSTKISQIIDLDELNTIVVDDISTFSTFEGLPVGTANTGYVKIGSEIIGYKAVTAGAGDAGSLTIADGSDGRAVDSVASRHTIENGQITKYELSGVSIKRLGKLNIIDPVLHNMTDKEKDLDSYYVQFDRTANGLSRSSDVDDIPQLSFTDNKYAGGKNVLGSRNILFNGIIPLYDLELPTGADGSKTNVSCDVRTVSGTSVGGNEISFEDKGYQAVQINRYNSLDSVRLVASKVNENQHLSNLPRSKSFTTLLNFSTNNPNISPALNIAGNCETEFVLNRLNNPIGVDNYAINPKVNSSLYDPHSAIYVSNVVNLSKPATSLKVILSAYRHSSSDIRVLYSLRRSDSDEIRQEFELFPGYKNLQDADGDGFGDFVIDETQNDGRSDSFVPSSSAGQYREYQYTADNLDLFTGYQVKIVMSGTNQAYTPSIRDLRTLAIR